MLSPQWVETILELSTTLATCTYLVSCSSDRLTHHSRHACDKSTSTFSSQDQFMNMFFVHLLFWIATVSACSSPFFSASNSADRLGYSIFMLQSGTTGFCCEHPHITLSAPALRVEQLSYGCFRRAWRQLIRQVSASWRPVAFHHSFQNLD